MDQDIQNLNTDCKNINIKKLLLVFLMSLIANFIGSWYGYAVANNQIFIQAILGLCIPVSNIFYVSYFIEAKTLKDRIKLTITAGLALSTASTLMLMLQPVLESIK